MPTQNHNYLMMMRTINGIKEGTQMKKKYNHVYQFKITLGVVHHRSGGGYKYQKLIHFGIYMSPFKTPWDGQVIICMNSKL